MTEKDSEILFYAFRYCLGRMTYAVSDFCEYAEEHIKEVGKHELELMNKEIDEAGDAVYSAGGIRQSGLGMDCDVVAWRKLQGLIKEELKRRKEKE